MHVRLPARISAALMLVTSLGLAPACDHAELPEAPRADAPAAVETSPTVEALRGSVYLATLSPAVGAEVVVTFESADGAVVREDLVTTDTHGDYAIATLPQGAATMHTHVFVDGALFATRTASLAPNLPDSGPQMIIGSLAGPLCPASTWASAMDLPPSEDKLRHCVASCRTVRWCGPSMARDAAHLKELLDSACQGGPDWLKKLLRKISQCTGWSAGDMQANQVGFAVAPRVWRTCERLCRDRCDSTGCR